MSNVTANLITLVAALGLACLLTPLVRHLAIRWGLVARPHAERWSPVPVAIGGGFAIAGATAVATMASTSVLALLPLALGSLLMFGLGALDDAYHFRPSSKLVAQTAIAATVLVLMPAPQITGMATLDAFIALVWLVGITNAFNLLDNIDGLSAGVAAIAGLSYLVALVPTGAGPLAAALAAFVGAALGFLVFNRRPASIFMGDSGSLFIGSFLAISSLLVTPMLTGRPVPAVAMPLLILLVPIFDTVFVSVTRGLAGRSPMLGGRDHLSHRLVAMGVEEARAVRVLYGLAALGGLGAVSLQYLEAGYATILIAAYVILLCWLGVVLGHVEAHGVSAEGRIPPLVSEVGYRNRVFEVSLDIALIALAYYAAFRLRFQGAEFAHFVGYFAGTFPLVIACQLAGLAVAGKYRHVWRTLGSRELLLLVKGIAIGVASSMLLLLTLYRFEGFSRLVFAIDAAVLGALLIGARLAATSVDEHLRRRRSRGAPVLIYGAGAGGALLVHVLHEDQGFGLVPVGFLDDDPAKRRLRLEGVPVVGTFADLERLIDALGVAQLIVSTKSIDRPRLAEAAALCRARGIAIRSLRFALDEIGPIASVRHVQSR
jgi:UDP-GlcNAc:undecaprenyl-phosphate/decaprenyl-phosphate GlcNAc-1-phosphate transferase